MVELRKQISEGAIGEVKYLSYEAEAVRQCINNGKKESDIMPLSHTQITANIMETVMKQLGRPIISNMDL